MGQSLQGASRATANKANLDALNAIGTDREGFTDILSPIEEAAANFIERVKVNIESSKMLVTGAIDDLSISAEGDNVKIYGPLHLIFQDKGVNGSVEKLYDTPFSYKDKLPPWQVFKDWINNRNLQLRNEEKYTRGTVSNKLAALEGDDKDIDIEKAARGMAYMVWKRGLKPRFVYSKEIPKLIEEIMELVPNFVASQVAESFGNLPPSNININL